MPKLIVPTLKTVALSEPVRLDGAIHFAAESTMRQTIEVWRAEIETIRLVNDSMSRVASLQPIATLPGGPTDNGIRAMWPRMDGHWLVYQSGAENALAHWSVFTETIIYGPSIGIWPIALSGPDTMSSPVGQSQGVFGYLDGRWWLFDDIRQSVYAAAYPQGVLFHGWRNEQGVLHLLFNESGTPPDELDARVILCTDEGGQWNRSVVFTGIARYPRGVSLPDGSVYVHAVADDGQYLAALSPFEALETPTMPTIRAIRIDNWILRPVESTTPASISALVTLTGVSSGELAEVVKQIRPKGQTNWISETQPEFSTSLQMFDVRDPGTYEWRCGLTMNGPFTSTREFTVTAPPKGETQVVTESDLDDLYQHLRGVAVTVNQIAFALVDVASIDGAGMAESRWDARYATLRAAGQAHEPARDAVVSEAWAFVEAEIAKAKTTS